MNGPSVESVAEILVRCCNAELRRVLQEGCHNDQQHYGVKVSWLHLMNACPELGQMVLDDPAHALTLIEEAACRAQGLLHRLDPNKYIIKRFVHPRITGLPQLHRPWPSEWRPRLSELASLHINKMVAISGTVVKLGKRNVTQAWTEYVCSTCKSRFVVRPDAQGGMPRECPVSGDCPGTRFTPVKQPAFTDTQDVKVQEKAGEEGLHTGGGMPAAVTVQLQHDLVNCCQPGDDIQVCGVVEPVWAGPYPSRRCTCELIVKANWVHVCPKARPQATLLPGDPAMFEEFWAAYQHAPMTARNQILAGVCPQIHGMFYVKLATLLMLIGGVPREDGADGSTRGSIHVLLVGDPGTGKSKIMQFAARVSPRSVVTSGKCSSGVGLTMAAVRDGPDWSLEAGALVLADGGLCCIDEFDGIDKQEQAAMHQAMEQQCISVDKAQIHTTVRTRASVLGAANFKGRYRDNQPLEKNVGVAPTLLSRFDVILLLHDARSKEWEREVALHILERDQARPPDAAPTSPWSLDMLQRYIGWVKGAFQPCMSPEAEEVLGGYYNELRACGEHSRTRTGMRGLESLVRLAQAHARLCARPMVLLADALAAVCLMEASLPHAQILPCYTMVNSHFSEDPDADAARDGRTVLRGLQLDHLLHLLDA